MTATRTDPTDAAAGFVRAATEGLGLQVAVTVDATTWDPPTEVAVALVGAVREALRNVVRHSGTARATLTVVSTRRGVRVEVADRGRGLGPGHEEGFGLRDSVREPMERVGGGADVGRPRHGRGTEVRLWWHYPPTDSGALLAAAYHATMRSSGGPSIARTVAVPMLLANAAVGLHTLDHARRPVLVVAVVVLLAAATVLALRQIEARAPTPRSVAGWGLWVALSSGVGLLLAGPGALLGFDSFAVGFAALPLVLLAFVSPPRFLPLLVLPPLGTVALAIGLDPTVGLATGLGALNAPVTPTATAAAIGAGLRRSVSKLDRQRAQVVRARADASESDFLARAAQRHLDHTRRRIVPWLDRLGAGDVDLDDPQVRTRAALLAAEARDDLYVPEFFDDDLRRLVTEYRRAGGTVVIRPGADPAVRDRTSGSVLHSLLVELPPGGRITFHEQADRGRVRLAVVPPTSHELTERLRSQHASLSTRSDAFATTMTLEGLP